MFKYAKLTAVIITVVIIFLGYNRWVFSLDLFKLYKEALYSHERHERVKNFNPDEDTFYLPGMEDKEFFASVNDFSIMRKKGVREFIYLYLTAGREYTVKSIERSGLYMKTISEIMKLYPDIPGEIALLPLLESGFDPSAVSKSKAVGLWQFMSGTSSHLGLRTDSLVDERRSVEKSTDAAIRHLRYLHEKFGSWDLALAAYNGGEGQLERAIERSGSKNIWRIIESGCLSRETSEYLPRYAALILIYRNPSLFHIDKELAMRSAPPVQRITLRGNRSLADIAMRYGISTGALKELNPELNSETIPQNENGYTLNIPAGTRNSVFAKMIYSLNILPN